MNTSWISAGITIGFIALFLGTTIWAYSKKNQSKFEHAARLPLEEVDFSDAERMQ
jgi:cbb3-type cytochrome oxidase subunit 3